MTELVATSCIAFAAVDASFMGYSFGNVISLGFKYMLCVQKADGSSGSLWFSAGHKHILSHLAHFVQVQFAEHVLHTLVGAELISLAAGGEVENDADDDVDHEDD